MTGLVDQVRGFAQERADGLAARGETGPAVGCAVVVAAVLQAYDRPAFDAVATPALAAVIGRDRAAANQARPAVSDLRRRSAGYGDPDTPGGVMEQVLVALDAAVALTAGEGGAEELVVAAVASLSLVERFGDVEAIPDERLGSFADLVADPGYLTAPVPVTWREAARQVRALRLVDEHPDPWPAILDEADVVGTQLRGLATVLRGLRGPVSQAYPTVQNLDFSDGRATALRTAPAELVAEAAALRTQVEVWVDHLVAFRGHRRLGPIPAVPASLIRSRELVVAVPPGSRSEQGRLFDALAQESAERPVAVAVRFLEVR